jgi:class 3 adenylate cyclase
MTGRPSGTVTFLFTDIEGSTRLWQTHPEAMSEALERHDVVLRAAIAAADGYVFSTAGDAFAAAFDRAGAAVEAAIEAQRMLQSEQWPVGVSLKARMGIHTGEAVERDGDYFGPTLNRGARVMSAAHGGQILVTGTTAGVLGASGVTLVDLGEHVLRDIDGAERLLQVASAGLSATFPALRTSVSARSSLPSQRSSFVGRDAEITRARTLLGSGRLVTLTGSGGCGKTRLAIEVASREVFGFTDGAVFVDLARIGSDDEVAEAFANAIDFAPEPGRPVDEQVRSRIGNKQMLLVVDNCEHVLDEIAEQVDALLAACRNVRIVATSREALGVDGETALRVPSMDVESAQGRPAAALLFLERVAESGAMVDPADDGVIVEICR